MNVKNIVCDIKTNVFDIRNEPLSVWDVAEMYCYIHKHGHSIKELVLVCDAVTKAQMISEAAKNKFFHYVRDHIVHGMEVDQICTPAGNVDLYETEGLPDGTAILVNFSCEEYMEQLKMHETAHGKFVNISKTS